GGTPASAPGRHTPATRPRSWPFPRSPRPAATPALFPRVSGRRRVVHGLTPRAPRTPTPGCLPYLARAIRPPAFRTAMVSAANRTENRDTDMASPFRLALRAGAAPHG